MPLKVRDTQGREFGLDPVKLVQKLQALGVPGSEGEIKEITAEGQIVLERKVGPGGGGLIPEEREEVGLPTDALLKKAGLERIGQEGALNTPDTALNRSELTFDERAAMGLLMSEAAQLKKFGSAVGIDEKSMDKFLANAKSRDPFIKRFLEQKFDEAVKVGDEWKVRRGDVWSVANAEGLDRGDMAELLGNAGSNMLATAVGAVAGAKTGTAAGAVAGPKGAVVGGFIGAVGGAIAGTTAGEIFEQEMEKRLVDALQLGKLSPEELEADRTAEQLMATTEAIPALGKLTVEAGKAIFRMSTTAGAKAITAVAKSTEGLTSAGKRAYSRFVSGLNSNIQAESFEAMLRTPRNALRAGKLVDEELAATASQASPIRVKMAKRIDQEITKMRDVQGRLFTQEQGRIKSAIASGQVKYEVASNFSEQAGKILDDIKPLVQRVEDERAVEIVKRKIQGMADDALRQGQAQINRTLPNGVNARITAIHGEPAFDLLLNTKREINSMLRKLKLFDRTQGTRNPDAVARLFVLDDSINEKLYAPVNEAFGVDNPLRRAMDLWKNTADEIGSLRKFLKNEDRQLALARQMVTDSPRIATKQAYNRAADRLNAFAGRKIIDKEKFIEDLGIMDGALSMRDVVPKFSNQTTMFRFAVVNTAAASAAAVLGGGVPAAIGAAAAIPAVLPRIGLRGVQRAARSKLAIQLAARRRMLDPELAQNIALRSIKVNRLNRFVAGLSRAEFHALLNDSQRFEQALGTIMSEINRIPDVGATLQAATAEAQR